VAGTEQTLMHDPEKREPLFGKDHAQSKALEAELIQIKQIGLEKRCTDATGLPT
jgi:hypothetical protein